jgi:hypothetical protein
MWIPNCGLASIANVYEPRVAEIEQTGEPDHDVEAEREQYERAGIGEKVDETAVRKDQRQHQRRSE